MIKPDIYCTLCEKFSEARTSLGHRKFPSCCSHCKAPQKYLQIPDPIEVMEFKKNQLYEVKQKLKLKINLKP